MKQTSPITWLFLIVILAGVGFVGLRQLTGAGVAPVPALFDDPYALQEAAEMAAGQDKYVFAVASADWCGPCQTYKRNALLDQRVQQWTDEHAIPVYVNVDRSQDDARMLSVGAIPATFVIKDEVVVAKFEGVADAEDLVRWLKRVDKYVKENES